MSRRRRARSGGSAGLSRFDFALRCKRDRTASSTRTAPHGTEADAVDDGRAVGGLEQVVALQNVHHAEAGATRVSSSAFAPMWARLCAEGVSDFDQPRVRIPTARPVRVSQTSQG